MKKYKSLEIPFINKYIVKNLCAFDEFYYFESEEIIEEAETISDEEFETACSKIIYMEPESITISEPQPTNQEIKNMISSIEKTQLTLIQQAVEKSNNELRQEGADTAILELIKKGIL